jgi:hypothetical protein
VPDTANSTRPTTTEADERTIVRVAELRSGDRLPVCGHIGTILTSPGIDGVSNGGGDTYRLEWTWPPDCPFAPVWEGIDGALRKTVLLPRPAQVDDALDKEAGRCELADWQAETAEWERYDRYDVGEAD